MAFSDLAILHRELAKEAAPYSDPDFARRSVEAIARAETSTDVLIAIRDFRELDAATMLTDTDIINIANAVANGGTQ